MITTQKHFQYGFQPVFLETYRKNTSLLYNPLCSIFVFLSFSFVFVGVTLYGPAGRYPRAYLLSECFSKEVAHPEVHFSTPGWFKSLGGRVPCLPTQRAMWNVFWLLVFILFFAWILTLLLRGWMSRASCYLEFQIHVDYYRYYYFH